MRWKKRGASSAAPGPRRARRSEALPAGLPIGVGFLSYDLGRRWIALPSRAADDHGWPALEFRFHDAVWMRDAATGAARILARDAAAARRLADRLARAAEPLRRRRCRRCVRKAVTRGYLAAVERILAYLAAGDAYQVNLARRLSATIGPGDPVWLAQALRSRAPAPHAIWLARNGGRDQLIGNSPERFLRTDGRGGIETRPIKGTRPARRRQRERSPPAAPSWSARRRSAPST